MQALTPGAQIDELRAVLRISEQRRQQAEARLADRDRRLGIASATIAAQDQQIGYLRAHLARLREVSNPEADRDSYERDAAKFFSI
jgi:hypothetical protein